MCGQSVTISEYETVEIKNSFVNTVVPIFSQGDDGVDYEFGIKPSGLLVKKRGNIIGNYVW